MAIRLACWVHVLCDNNIPFSHSHAFIAKLKTISWAYFALTKPYQTPDQKKYWQTFSVGLSYCLFIHRQLLYIFYFLFSFGSFILNTKKCCSCQCFVYSSYTQLNFTTHWTSFQEDWSDFTVQILTKTLVLRCSFMHSVLLQFSISKYRW